MGYSIFISYRRKDSATEVESLYRYLTNTNDWFSKNDIFRDVGSIESGQGWAKRIQQSLEEAKIVLVMIGKKWMAKGRDGQLRINNEDDWVRKEIETALKSEGKIVIPILIDGAKMPDPKLLPEPVRGLCGLQFREITFGDDDDDLFALGKHLHTKINDFDPSDEVKSKLMYVLASKYEIKKNLGAGSKAKVYLGQDTGLERSVAIKVLVNTDFNSSFVDTLKYAAKVNDSVPNSISVLGAYVKREPYHVIMPYLQKGTLRKFIKDEGKQPNDYTRNILVTIGNVLKAIHAQHLVHNNVKPSNIILNEQSEPYLNLLSHVPDLRKETALENLQRLAATKAPADYQEDLCYLPPDIFDTRPSNDVIKKQKMDQYMLGLIGYQLLTGEIPPRVKDIATLLEKQGEAFLALPRLTDIRKDCPNRFAAIIHKMIEKDPRKRYDSMGEAVRDLREISFNPSEMARESFKRCLAVDGSGNAFFKAFYDELIKTSPMAGTKFHGKKDTEFGKQYIMLRDAIFMLLAFGESKDHNSDPNILSRIARLHGNGEGNYHISVDSYNEFIDAFLNTVCGTPTLADAFDPECRISEQENEIIRSAWDDALKPGIDYMKGKC
jgi:serine/threonine protein kinase